MQTTKGMESRRRGARNSLCKLIYERQFKSLTNFYDQAAAKRRKTTAGNDSSHGSHFSSSCFISRTLPRLPPNEILKFIIKELLSFITRDLEKKMVSCLSTMCQIDLVAVVVKGRCWGWRSINWCRWRKQWRFVDRMMREYVSYVANRWNAYLTPRQFLQWCSVTKFLSRRMRSPSIVQ